MIDRREFVTGLAAVAVAGVAPAHAAADPASCSLWPPLPLAILPTPRLYRRHF
ncbi:twin-arginine translocation signal domain-containing protein [Rhizobium sp. 2YAF20]|uniref:twin-arginine translocation signal domain-containing protein n=1 Tax=Rhizobium sp. 2YAF20 TaxID=3233027 RepID=UPI003F9BDD66